METGFAEALQAFVDEDLEHPIVPQYSKLRANQVCGVCHQPKSEHSGSLNKVSPNLRKHVCSGIQCLDPRKCICSTQIELCKHFHQRVWARYSAAQKKKMEDEKMALKQQKANEVTTSKKKKKVKHEQVKTSLFARLETAKEYLKTNEEHDPNKLMNMIQDVLLKSEGVIETPVPASPIIPIVPAPATASESGLPSVLSIEEELSFQQQLLQQQINKVKEVEEKFQYKKNEEAKFPALLEMIQTHQVDISLLLPYLANTKGFSCTIDLKEEAPLPKESKQEQ